MKPPVRPAQLRLSSGAVASLGTGGLVNGAPALPQHRPAEGPPAKLR